MRRVIAAVGAESEESPFLARLARGPIVGDGAMGTLLLAQGAPPTACLEELNRRDPERVLAVHAAYLAAGAAIVGTNTFGANRFRLGAHGLADDVAAINATGVALARQACAARVRGPEGTPFVAGCIGPLGRDVPLADAQDAFAEQAAALLAAGVDLLSVETVTDLTEMRAALTAIRALSDVPLVAQMAFAPDYRTRDGADPPTAALVMRELGADLVGANCGHGPDHTIAVLQTMRQTGDLLLAARPSAGLPTSSGAGLRYPIAPDAFAQAAHAFLALGVRLLGGCCGTTPAHIAAMIRLVLL